MQQITKRNISSLLLLFITCVASVNASEPVDMPAQIDGAQTVDAEGLIELVGEAGLVLVDARISSDRIHGYIEGSHSLPDVETNCQTLAEIIPDKHQAVLFYCNGVKCGRSVKSIRTALACGYDKLYWFRGGFEEWHAKQYPVIKL